MKIDSVTGLSNDAPLRQRVYEHARTGAEPAVHVEADLLNLRQVTNALGYPLADRLYRLTCNIFRQCLADQGALYVYGYRQSGDETSFIAGGLTPEAAAVALAEADRIIAGLCAETSLDHLVHHKRPAQSGFGVNTALEAVSAQNDIEGRVRTLQAALYGQKLAQGKADGALLSPSFFHPDSKRGQVEAVIARHEAAYPVPDVGLLPSGVAESESGVDVPVADIAAGPSSLLRIDLLNMGGINDTFGKSVTDHILSHVEKITRDVLTQNGLDFTVVRNAGVFDLVLRTQDTQRLSMIKEVIVKCAAAEIFSLPAAAYFAQEGIEPETVLPKAPAAKKLCLLPDSREQRAGTGIVLEAFPVAPEDYPSVSSRLEQTIALLKFYNVSCLVDHESAPSSFASLKNRFLSSLGVAPKKQVETGKKYKAYLVDSLSRPAVLENKDNAGRNAMPYALSLQSELTPQRLGRMLSLPPARLMHFLMGVDITPYLPPDSASVVQMQSALRAAAADGVDVDYSLKLLLKARSLARCEDALQFAGRYDESLAAGRTYITQDDSRAYLLNDVHVNTEADAVTVDGDLEHIMLASALAVTSIHSANLMGRPIDPALKSTVSSLMKRTAKNVADDLQRRGRDDLAACFKSMPLEKDTPDDGSIYMLYRLLERQRVYLKAHSVFDEAQAKMLDRNFGINPDRVAGEYNWREDLERATESHKVWRETKGAVGARFVTDGHVYKSSMAVQETNRRNRGHGNADVLYDFSDAIIKNSRLMKLDCGSAVFHDAILEDTVFDCSLMDGADFRRVEKLARCSFAFCELGGAKFTVSQDLMGCTFPPVIPEYGPDHTPDYNKIEFYMPDGRRVYGFNGDDNGGLHFKPEARDHINNRLAGVTAREVAGLIGPEPADRRPGPRRDRQPAPAS